MAKEKRLSLLEIRTKLNLKQKNFAEMLGISDKTLCSIEKERIKTNRTLIILANLIYSLQKNKS